MRTQKIRVPSKVNSENELNKKEEQVISLGSVQKDDFIVRFPCIRQNNSEDSSYPIIADVK